MKLVIKIFAGIVLTLVVAIGAVIGYQIVDAKTPVEVGSRGYFTLGENGTTIYIPEAKIEEDIIEEKIIEEKFIEENVIDWDQTDTITRWPS